MRTKFSLLQCKLSEMMVTKRIRLGESQLGGEGGVQAAADQVPVCWSLDFNVTTWCTHRQTYTADQMYTNSGFSRKFRN